MTGERVSAVVIGGIVLLWVMALITYSVVTGKRIDQAPYSLSRFVCTMGAGCVGLLFADSSLTARFTATWFVASGTGAGALAFAVWFTFWRLTPTLVGPTHVSIPGNFTLQQAITAIAQLEQGASVTFHGFSPNELRYAFTPRRRISRDGSLVGDRNRSMFS